MSKTDSLLCDLNTPMKVQNVCQPIEVTPDVSYLNENLVKSGEKSSTSPQCNVPSVHLLGEKGALKKSYKCFDCEREFSQKLALKRHILIHTGEKPYSCTFCNKRFSQIANRNLHLRTHTGEHSHKCPECGEGFIRSDGLQRHMVVHTGVMPFGCRVCPKRFMRSTSLKKHMRLHADEDKGFASINGIALTTSHDGEDRDPQKCYVSTTNVPPSNSTQMPSVTSAICKSPKVSNDACISSTGHQDSRQLDQQININTRVKTESSTAPNMPKDFNVPVESVKYAQDVGVRDLDYLKEHFFSTDESTSSDTYTDSTSKISNTDSVLCDVNTSVKGQNICQPIEVVPDVSYLNENLVKTEDESCTSPQFNAPSEEVSVNLPGKKGTSKKLYKCSTCSRKFGQKITLERHILSHTGEKPFSCTFCNKRFAQLAHRNVHLITAHTGEYTYRCSICGRGFHRSNGLQRHMEIHTRVPFECPVCHSKFTHSTYLKRHMRLHDSENSDKGKVSTNGLSLTNSYVVQDDVSITSTGHQDSAQLDRQININTRVKTESVIPINVPQDSNVPVESVKSANLEDDGFHDLNYLKEHLVSTDKSVSANLHSDSTSNRSQTNKATSLPHKCPFCNKQFPMPSGLKWHMITHSAERPFKCSQCDKAFRLESHLTAHAQIHTRPKLYECFDCDESFLYMHQLQKHLINHVLENPNMPLFRNKTAGHADMPKDTDRGGMKKKQQNLSVHSISYDQLPKDQHIATHGQSDLPQHLSTEEGSSTPNGCSEPMAGNIMQENVLQDANIFLKSKESAQLENVGFHDLDYLKEHLVSTDESTSSDPCTNSTSNISNTDSLLCDVKTPVKGQNVCEPIKVVPDVSYLNENLVNVSEDRKNGAFVKRFECATCSHRFPSKRELDRHILTHTGEKPYSCTICNKRFSQMSNVTVHLRIHTGEHPYKCSVCGEGFIRSDALQRHMVIHTGVMPFGCPVCPKRFMRSTSLKSHMRRHTGETSDKDYASTNGLSPTTSTQIPYVTTAACNGPKVSNDACISTIGHQDSPQPDQQMNMNTRLITESFIAPNVSKDSNVPVESVKSSQIWESLPGTNKPESPLVTSQQSAATPDAKPQLVEKPHQCQVCGIRFRQEGVLKKHLQLHETGILSDTPHSSKQVLPERYLKMVTSPKYTQPVIPEGNLKMTDTVMHNQSSKQAIPVTGMVMASIAKDTQNNQVIPVMEAAMTGTQYSQEVIPVTGVAMDGIVNETQNSYQVKPVANHKMAERVRNTQPSKDITPERNLKRAKIEMDTQNEQVIPVTGGDMPDMSVPHPQYRAKCSYCSEVFTNDPDFRVHMMTHKKIKGNVRKNPAKIIKEYYSPTHIEPVHNVPKASETGLVFQLKQHSQDGNPNVSLYNNYAPKPGPPYICGVCNMAYRHLCSLKRHMQSHAQEQAHQSPANDTEPTPSPSIKQNAMGHSTQKGGTHIINEHSLAQLTKKPPQLGRFGFSECHECIQGFSNPQDLVTHIMTNHKEQAHGDLAPYARQKSTNAAIYNWSECHKCPQCIKGYTNEHELMAHMVLHRNDQDPRSSVSGGDGHLPEHQVVSSTDGNRQCTKPYACHLCGIRFKLLTMFWQHLKLHD